MAENFWVNEERIQKNVSKKYEFGQNFGRYKERSYDADNFLFIFL